MSSFRYFNRPWLLIVAGILVGIVLSTGFGRTFDAHNQHGKSVMLEDSDTHTEIVSKDLFSCRESQ